MQDHLTSKQGLLEPREEQVLEIMLSVVALMFILSGGHPGTVMKAKNGLRHVVYGLALLVLAPLLVNLVISVAGG